MHKPNILTKKDIVIEKLIFEVLTHTNDGLDTHTCKFCVQTYCDRARQRAVDLFSLSRLQIIAQCVAVTFNTCRTFVRTNGGSPN